MAPFLLTAQKPKRRWPKYPPNCRKIILRGFRDKRSRECRSKWYVSICCMLPIRSRTTCTRPALSIKYIRNNDVLRLYVSVQYVEGVQVPNSLANICQFRYCLLLPHPFTALDQAIEWSILHVLHENVEIEGILEKAVEFYHVGVCQEETDLDLLNELLEHQPHSLLLHLLHSQ